MPIPIEVVDFARTLGATPLDTIDAAGIEPPATHCKPKRRYETRMRMASRLDPHRVTIDGWLVAEPAFTAPAIVGRLATIYPATSGDKQQSIVHRLLRSLRRQVAETSLAAVIEPPVTAEIGLPGAVDGAPSRMLSAPPKAPPSENVATRASRPACRGAQGRWL